MQIYLLKDLPKQGKAGEIITVSDGYGRNFVIKNGYGRVADAGTVTHVKQKTESQAFHKGVAVASTKETIEKLRGIVVTVRVKVGAGGKLFGGVTGGEISTELGRAGFEIDKKNLVFEPIKTVGVYKVRVKFEHSLTGEFTLNVEAL